MERSRCAQPHEAYLNRSSVSLPDHIATLFVVTMVMTAIARETVVGRTDAQGTIEPESNQALSGESDPATTRYGLTDGAGAGTRGGADSGTLSAASDGADDRTQYSASAHILTSSFVSTYALFPGVVRGNGFISSADRVTLAVDVNGFEVEYDCVLRNIAHDQFGVGPPGHDHPARAVANVLVYNAREDSAV